MPWIVPAISAVGAVASALGNKRSTSQVVPDIYNAYGERNTPNTGAIGSRDAIFNALKGYQPGLTTATGNYASALTGAAQDPRLAASSDYAMKLLRGDYLQSPLVNEYATQAGNQIRAGAGDTRARVGAALARGGQGFSTGQVQALQTGDTAAAARAAELEAQIRGQNYQAERGNQMQAPGLVSGAVREPLNYMSMVPGAYLNPLTTQAGLTTTLLGSNLVKDQTLMQQPSLSDTLAAGANAGVNIYDLLKQLNLGGAAVGTKGSTVAGAVGKA